MRCDRQTKKERCPNRAVVRLLLIDRFNQLIDVEACAPCAQTFMIEMHPGEQATVRRLL